MINAQVRQSGQGGGADRLHRPARRPRRRSKITASTVTGAEPDKANCRCPTSGRRAPASNPFYTIQDQAFPKKQADQYFAVQSDVLQGKVTPAEAAKQMQDVVSAWAKS